MAGRKRLNMKLGFAHPVYVTVPENIQAETPFPTRIVLRGTDKHALGEFAAEIRRWRKPEPYKGKVRCILFTSPSVLGLTEPLQGIFVGDETIKLKNIKKK